MLFNYSFDKCLICVKKSPQKNAEKQNQFETKDVVGDIIEKVLESGGDVEFVEELKDYNRIALIEYYHGN
jgi:hypothetical protein